MFPTWDSLDDIYKALDKKRKGMKLYVTEAGYTTGTTPFRTVKVTLSVQNKYLKQIYNLPLVKSPRWPPSSGSTSRTTSTGLAGSCGERQQEARATTRLS